MGSKTLNKILCGCSSKSLLMVFDLTSNADKKLVLAQRPYNFGVIGIFTGRSRRRGVKQEALAVLTVCPQYKLLIVLYILQEQLI